MRLLENNVVAIVEVSHVKLDHYLVMNFIAGHWAEAITGNDVKSAGQTGRHTTWWREGRLGDTQRKACNMEPLLCSGVAWQQGIRYTLFSLILLLMPHSPAVSTRSHMHAGSHGPVTPPTSSWKKAFYGH